MRVGTAQLHACRLLRAGVVGRYADERGAVATRPRHGTRAPRSRHEALVRVDPLAKSSRSRAHAGAAGDEAFRRGRQEVAVVRVEEGVRPPAKSD